MSALQARAANEALAMIPAGEERVLVATGRYLGEGFDDARLDTLFLTMPISWRGSRWEERMAQALASATDASTQSVIDVTDFIDRHPVSRFQITA